MKKKLIIIGGIILFIIIGVLAYLFFFTNILQNKLIPKLENTTIEYAPGMDYQKAIEGNQAETPMIEMQTIKLSEQEIKELKKLLKPVKESSKKKDFSGFAKINLNKDSSILIGEKFGKLENKKETKYITITKSLLKRINELIKNNNDKVLNSLSFEKFVIRKNGAVITLANKTNIEIVKEALPYYNINLQEDYSTYDNGYQEIVILDDTTIIYLYNNNIGYIRNNNENYYVVFPYGLKDEVESIYNKSIEEK